MPHLRQSVLCGAAAFALACGTGAAARAETLADAIALAYQSNPTLQQSRALQRATDEGYVQARAGLRPTVSAGVTGSYENDRLSGFTTDVNSVSAQLSASQPLYTGGRTAAQVRAAEADIRSGRESLRQTENQTLQAVVQAYLDVRRDQEIVGIRQANLDVLMNQFEESKLKFQVGQIPRTDVAQAEAQYAQARSLLSTSQANLQVSRANYTSVVGQNPGDLAPEPPLPGIPATVDAAFDIAQQDSPAILAAQYAEQASLQRVAEARSAGAPQLALTGSVGYAGPISPADSRDYGRAITAGATFTQPLFTGGVIRSQVRAALERNTGDRIAVEGARRQVVQQVSQAWNVRLSAHANTQSNEQQVAAAALAFEGAQAEYRAGLRSTIDLLIIQQQLRDAQLQLVTARHDEYVAGAVLLAAMGRLEARSLTAGVPLYDSAANFARVKEAGATPYDGALLAFDRVGGARATDAGPIPAPPPPSAPPVLLAPDAPLTAHAPIAAPPATATPTAPAPRTTAPSTPATLGARPGVAADSTPPASTPSSPAGPATPSLPEAPRA